MNLIKTSMLTGLQSVVRIASSLLLTKIIAVYVGPSGYAIMGQFQNLIALMTSLAGGILATGVTKATAEHYDNEVQQHKIWKTAIRFSVISTLVMAIGLIVFRDWLSMSMLNQASMSDLFIWLACTLPLLASKNIIFAIVNGKKETVIFVLSGIIGGLLIVALIIAMTTNLGLHGTLISYALGPILSLFTIVFFIVRTKWFLFEHLWGKIDWSVMSMLAGYGVMGLLSAIMIPVTLIVIRNHLTANFGLDVAGYWQATWKISEIYLTLVTGSLAVYYLPRLAEIRTSIVLKKEILAVYKLVLPVTMIGALIIYFLRDFIIHFLFTSDFMPMRDLFFWQLIGDVLKIGGWILAYVMVGRAMVKTYLISEFLLWMTFMLMALWLGEDMGAQGVALAYAVTYAVFWVAMIFVVRYEMERMDESSRAE